MNSLYIIQTRFSLFNKNTPYWRVNRVKSVDEALTNLLNEDRLRERCDIFFNYTLPQINEAYLDGSNIKHILMFYDKLPGWVLNKLSDASISYPWLVLKPIGYEDDISFNQPIIDEVIKLKNSSTVRLLPTAGIRLDDDDILGKSFFKNLSRYNNSNFINYCISFPNGYAALWDKEFIKFANYRQEKIALGLSQINVFDFQKNKFLSSYILPPGTHSTVDERVATILDSTNSPCYIRTFHNSNDTVVGMQNGAISKMIDTIFKDPLDSFELSTI